MNEDYLTTYDSREKYCNQNELVSDSRNSKKMWEKSIKKIENPSSRAGNVNSM